MASYYDAWKKSRGEEDDDKKKQQTISGESTSTSDNNLVKEESKTSYYEAWMKSRGEEIPVDKPKEQKIESEPVKDVKKPVVEQKKNIWEKIKDTFQKLRKLTQAPDDGTDSDVDKEARKRMEESTMKEVPTSEVLKRYQEDPVGYLVSRPYYSSKDKYLEQDKDLSTKDVMQKKLQAYGDYYNSLDEVGKARLTNPVEGLSDDSYAYIKLNTDNILKETDLEIQALYSQLETAEGKDARQIKKYLGELEEQKKDLEYIQKGVVENKGFIDGLAEGFTDVKNIPVVGSIIRADEAIDTLRAWRKYENGEDLSTREKMLVNRIKTAEIESISEEKDIGYNIASGVATSVSLMVEVGLALAIPTPVDGEIALATRGASGVGKFAIGAGNLLWKAGKITATTGVPKIIESTATYQSPEMSFDWEENDFDKIEEGDEFSDALLKSIAKEYGNNLIEVGLGDTLDASTKAVKKGIANMVGKEIQATSKNQVITFLRTKGGWNGFLGEFSEEIAQKYYEEGVIDNKEVKFTPEELVAIAGSVLLLQGAGEVVGQFGAEQDGMREQIEAEAEANIRATVQEADKRTTEEDGGTVQEEVGKQDTPVVDVEEEMLKADIAQVEQGLKAEPVQEVKIEGGEVKTDYSEDAKVQEVLRDISMVLDIGARKKVTSMDEVTGDYRSGVDGVIIPEFIPEELRSRKYVQKAYDAFLSNTIPQEGTKAWQVYQAILDESKGREGLEIQEPEITTERIQDTIKVDGLNEEQQLEIAKDVWAKSSGSDAFENANQPIANAKSFDEVIKIIKEVSGSNYDAVISSYGIALDTRFNILRRREVNKTQKEQVKEGKFALKVEKLRKDAPVYITDLKVSDEAVNVAFEKLTGADLDIKDIPADLRAEVQKVLDAINNEMDKRIAEDTVLQREMEGGFTREELAGYLAMDVLEDREYEAEMQKELTPLEEDVITDDDLPFRQRELKVLEDKFLDNLNIERMKEFSREWFGDENVEVVKNILRNNKALGMYLNRLIEIKNGQAHVGSTFYHEAVHKAFDIFLTADEKKVMISEVIKRVGRDNLKKMYNNLNTDEKFRIASYQNEASRIYMESINSVQRAGVGVDKISSKIEWKGKKNLLEDYAKRFDIKPENLWGSTVQVVDKNTNEKRLYLVDGEIDATHAQALIDGTDIGIAGEDRKGLVYHITAMKPTDFENPYFEIDGVFDPSKLPYSEDISKRSAQREYRLQFGIAKTGNVKYRGVGVSDIDAMAQEWLAENVIDYINNRNSTTFWGKLKRMVDIFVDRVFRGIDHVKDIEDFYESLISGRLLDRQQKLEAKQQKNWNKYLASIQGTGTKTDAVYRTEVAKEIKKLTTKILKKLEGKDSVKKQFISDLTKQQDIKQVEKDIINDVLKTFPDDIDVATFEEKVLAQLLPLERETLSSSQYAMVTVPSSTDSLGYSDWDYSENIYTSPIEVKAGLQHFGFSTEDQEMLKRDQDIVDRYFGHTRVENSKNIRRVLEVQSDLYQKGVLEKELNAIKPQLNIFNVENKAQVQTLLGEPKAKEYGDLWQGVYDGQFDPSKKIGEKGLKRMTELETEAINIAQSRLDESNLSQYKNPTAHLRMVREEVRQASLDNVKTLLFPTGKTSAYIEGFLKPDRFKNTKGEIIHNVKGLKYGDIITDSQTNNEWIVLSVNDNGMQNRIFAKPMSSVLTKDSKDLELSSGGVLDTLIKSFGFDFYMKGKKLIPKDSEEIVKYIRSKGGKVSAELFIELLRRDASTAYKTVGLANGYTGDPLALNAVIKKEGFDGNDLIDIADIHKDFTWSGEAFYIGETQNYEKVLGNPEWKATVDFYEKDLGKYLKNNYEAKEFVDEDGYTWWKVDIKPEYAGAVEAFRLDEMVDYGKVADKVRNIRWMFPKVRGGWTKDKILKQLKKWASDYSPSGKSMKSEIKRFNSPEELAENIYYHGSANSISNLKPSIAFSEEWVEQYGGGGYGQQYWGISLSKDRNIASNFTGGLARSGNVAMVLLKKEAKVESMPEIEDAVEIEDIIEDLWNKGVDAVKIGDWKNEEYGERELVVLNPKAIVVGQSESFQVSQKPKMPSFDMEKITKMFNDAQKDDTDTIRYRLEEEVSVKLPELITMATELGANIKLQKSFRKGGKLGDFTAGEDTDSRIRILRTLFEPQGEEVMDGEGNVEKLPETPEQQMDRIHGIEKVLAHEIGHLFDWFGGENNMTLKRGNILGRIANLRSYTEGQFMDLENKEVRKELKTLTQVWNPFDEASVPKKYKTYRYSAKELYAEALSVFLNKPSLVKEVAPNFYQGFIEYMARKKEVQKEYFAIRDMIKQGNEVQSRVENMKKAQEIARGKRMTIDEEKEAYKKQSKWQEAITGIKMGFVNQYAPYLDKLRKAWKDKKITLSRLEEAEQLMGDLALKGNDAVKYAQDVQNEFFVPVSEAGIDMDTIGQILVLERNLGDRLDLANPHGLVYDYAKETYDYVKGQLTPAQWNLLSEKLSWWRDYNFDLVRKGYEAGVYSEQFFNEIATVNKNTYTPFAVVDYIEDNYVTAGVIQAVGTTKGVENPLTTQMLKSLSLMKLTATNGAKQDVVKSLAEIFPEEIVKADAIKDADGRTIGFKKNPKLERTGYTQLELLEDGKRTAYYMDRYIVSMFESSLNGVGWEIARFVTAPLRMVNRIFKPAVTVMKASFQFYSNPLKDYQRSLTNLTALSGLFDKSNVASRTAKVFGAFTKEWVKNLKRSWNYAGGEIDAVTQKMLDMYVLSSNVKYEDIDIGNEKFKFDPVKNRIVYKGGVNWLETLRDWGSTIPVIKHTLVPVYDFYMRAGSTFEVNSKIAGFQYLSNQVGDEKASFYTRRYVGTPDYMQKGKFTPLTNELIVFSNVGIQAITADMDLATRPKTASGYWVSTMFKIVFPKLLMLLGASLLRVPIPDPDDPEKKKWVNPYDYLSEYYKSMYMAFPIGYDEESESFMFVKAPSDEVGAVIGNLIWKMATYLQGEGMKVEQLGSAIAGLVPFTTGDNPLLSIGRDWMQYAQGRNPYDDFRGRLAINTSKWNEGGMTRFTEMLKWTSNEMGLTNFSTYDKSSDTTLEKTMNLPLLERMFELTNYGLQEREENEKALGKKEKNKTLDGYIESYFAEPSNKKLLELQEKYVIAIKGERPKRGWSGAEKAEETRLKSEFKREILANSGNAVYKSIAKAGLDNEQKLEIINKQKKKMSDEEFKDFMAQAVRYEVVKGEMFATYVKDKNLSQDLVYKVVKESIPVLSADSNNTLLWELRKVDAMSNDTLYQLAKDGLITSAGYMKYKDLNSTSYEKRYGEKDDDDNKTKLF